MPLLRRLRWYEKKRGSRRTGSQRLARAAEALFFAALTVAGAIAAALMLGLWLLPEWQANRKFVAADAQVLETRLVTRTQDGVAMYRPEVRLRLSVDGRRYEAWAYDVAGVYATSHAAAEAALAPFKLGAQTPAWYDPADPQRMAVELGYSYWAWLLLLVPLPFVVVGLVGLGFVAWGWGHSAERVSAATQQNPALEILQPALNADFPAVPDDEDWRNSPGTRLAYRLPVSASAFWPLFGLLAGTVIWNGVVLGFLVPVVRGLLRGQPDWWLTGFVVPFAAIGGFLVYYLARQLLLAGGRGTTRIEVSAHPLHPGGGCQVLVSHTGQLTLDRLEVFLVCDEQASYRQGTDTRTETQRVYQELVFSIADIQIQPALPFEEQFELRVPEGAMHSFRSPHHEIAWKLVVRVEVRRWPPAERSFSVLVYPHRWPARISA
ncbi:MAG: DUF3592 domain-containing protein [Pirellulales bacterium]